MRFSASLIINNGQIASKSKTDINKYVRRSTARDFQIRQLSKVMSEVQAANYILNSIIKIHFCVQWQNKAALEEKMAPKKRKGEPSDEKVKVWK